MYSGTGFDSKLKLIFKSYPMTDTLMIFLKDRFEKNNEQIRKKHAKLPSMPRLSINFYYITH